MVTYNACDAGDSGPGGGVLWLHIMPVTPELQGAGVVVIYNTCGAGASGPGGQV